MLGIPVIQRPVSPARFQAAGLKSEPAEPELAAELVWDPGAECNRLRRKLQKKREANLQYFQ
jgi:hypothetical protein